MLLELYRDNEWRWPQIVRVKEVKKREFKITNGLNSSLEVLRG